MSRPEQEGPVISLSEQLERDKKSVETDLAYARETIVGLMEIHNWRNNPALKVRREKIDKGDGSFDTTSIELMATAEEVTAAPDKVQALFIDLGIRKGDEIGIQLRLGRDSRYAQKLYDVMLIPTTYRPDLLGIEFTHANQLWFLKSGLPFEGNHHAEYTVRSAQINHAYHLMLNGLVHDSHEVGTHASYTEYKHMQHPRLTAAKRAVADWIVGLIDVRMK